MNEDWNDVDFSSLQLNGLKARSTECQTKVATQRNRNVAAPSRIVSFKQDGPILPSISGQWDCHDETRKSSHTDQALADKWRSHSAALSNSAYIQSNHAAPRALRVQPGSASPSGSSNGDARTRLLLSQPYDLNDIKNTKVESLRAGIQTNERVTRVQDRLRQGLRPRRSLAPEVIEGRPANSRNYLDVCSDDDLAGLTFPSSGGLILAKRLRNVSRVSTDFDINTEDWARVSIEKKAPEASYLRSSRESTSSSNLSVSLSSALESDDDLEGVELPENLSQLQQRLQATRDARSAGDTIRMPTRTKKEDPIDGLVLGETAFFRPPKLVHQNLKTISGKRSFDHQIHGSLRASRLPIPGARHPPKRPAFGTGFTSTPDHLPGRASPTAQVKTPGPDTEQKIQVKTSLHDLRLSGTLPDRAGPTKASVARSTQRLSRPTRPAFMPAGSTGFPSHHVSALPARLDRADSQLKAGSPSESQAGARRRATASEALKLEAAKRLTRTHVRAKTYGEGHELDDFDDLPTNETVDAQARSQPFLRTVPRNAFPDRSKTSASKVRELQAPVRNPKSADSSPIGKKLVSDAKSVTQNEGQKLSREIKRSKRRRPNLPGLITGINTTPLARREKNMLYNPTTFRWEGNEDEEMHRFDSITSPPRPALITNGNASKMDVQVVNGMVFDPEQMCWVKLSDEDGEKDPFEGLDDLTECPQDSTAVANQAAGQFKQGEFAVGEEFDAGPVFIRRQRDEEIKWRRWTRHWVQRSNSGWNRGYLHDIYDLLMDD